MKKTMATMTNDQEMKLSKAQQEVMNYAKNRIDYVRTHDFLHWLGHNTIRDLDRYPDEYESNLKYLQKKAEEDLTDAVRPGYYHERYKAERNCEVSIMCNGRTLKKLAEYGLIEIIFDSTGQRVGVDEIRVLNY